MVDYGKIMRLLHEGACEPVTTSCQRLHEAQKTMVLVAARSRPQDCMVGRYISDTEADTRGARFEEGVVADLLGNLATRLATEPTCFKWPCTGGACVAGD